MKTKCLFLDHHCEKKEFCDACPVYYDWAVYEVHKKKYMCPYLKESTCITKTPYTCWNCELTTYFKVHED